LPPCPIPPRANVSDVLTIFFQLECAKHQSNSLEKFAMTSFFFQNHKIGEMSTKNRELSIKHALKREVAAQLTSDVSIP
jgi:hypothetical protein